jgi:hypothetical protein
MYIFDCEVFKYDWLFVFKEIETENYTVIHNDYEEVKAFMDNKPVLVGFNNKHYDQFILKAILEGVTPEEVKNVNDYIIQGGIGWNHPIIQASRSYINQFDLFDDCQVGLSLKAIEAHLGMDIEETEVDFNINRPLNQEELERTIKYCKHDVDTTEKLYHLRQGYLENKLMLGRIKGIDDVRALYMTNAKLTSAYLDAVRNEYNDERNYVYPKNLLKEYIPDFIFGFFDRLKDKSIPDDEIFKEKIEFNLGECNVTVAYGGIHGAIPCYLEESTDKRVIRNVDVASYYPHLMTLDGYCSRSIPDKKIYADMLERRMEAKRTGDKKTANALKLVANTTYGATLNQYNDLYDPLMARSVCITGQLRLLELTNHIIDKCKSVKVIQLNTDGLMISLDVEDLDKYKAICSEWQARTGFELEEDKIKKIIQKDVNNYIEIAENDKVKIKGGYLVRGIAPAGAFNVNNNATIVAKAIVDYFVKGTPVEDTINACEDVLSFQLIAKASHKYSKVYHSINQELVEVQRCNRVYASKDYRNGTLYKVHKETKNLNKIALLPISCIVDNKNTLSIDDIDKSWYIALAKKQIRDFRGIKPPKFNTRKLNSIKKNILNLLEV